MGKEERGNKRRVRDRLTDDTQIKWRCARLRLCGEAAHHETNDGDEGGTRKGNDDETEGETKAEYERTAENAQGQKREKRTKKKGAKVSLKIAPRRERSRRLWWWQRVSGNGRWLKNEVIW